MKPTYDLKARDEVGWAGVAIALGGLVGVIIGKLTDDVEIATASAVLVTGLARFLGGALLPRS